MTQLYSNNVDTALEQAAGSADASLLLVDGSDLHEPTGSDFELLTITYNGLFEIVKVTGRTTNTVTVTRAQEGTTARDWPKGARVYAGITAGTLDAFQAAVSAGNGWSPILAIVSDGSRRVLQVYDWTGGDGTKPTTGEYIGSAGLVTNIADAIDIRGPAGAEGDDGWNPYLAVVADGDRRVLKLENWFGGEGTTPSFVGYYLSSTGLTSDISLATDIRGAEGAGSSVKNSIEDDGGSLQLVGDTLSPGADKMYGTDGAGAKGWRSVPATGWDPTQAVRDSLTMVAGFAIPPGATALGTEAIAIQAARSTDDQIASGNYSIALGTNSKASALQAVAVGWSSRALGQYAVSMGPGSNASFQGCVSIGNNAYSDDSYDTTYASLAIGNGSYADGSYALAVGPDAYCELAKACAVGGETVAYGENACALGYGSNASHGTATAINGGVTKFEGHLSTMGLPAALSANTALPFAVSSVDHGKWNADNVSIMSDVVDLTVTGDVEIVLPAGVHFFPDECGIIITDASGTITQAQISFGSGTASSESLVNNATTSGLDAAYKRERFTSLNSPDGLTTISAHVKTAGGGTTYSARFYWKGFAVCDE